MCSCARAHVFNVNRLLSVTVLVVVGGFVGEHWYHAASGRFDRLDGRRGDKRAARGLVVSVTRPISLLREYPDHGAFVADRQPRCAAQDGGQAEQRTHVSAYRRA